MADRSTAETAHNAMSEPQAGRLDTMDIILNGMHNSQNGHRIMSMDWRKM